MSDAGRGVQAGVDGPEGFASGLALAADELQCIKARIEAQWLERLRAHQPQHAERFQQAGIERYHELAHLVDHTALWSKPARLFASEVVTEIRATSLLRRLAQELGELEISDEEGIGRDNIYWRIVRPWPAGDAGGLHADAWFWELGHGATPPRRRRIKVWVAVISEAGRNGLRLVRGSHRRAWRYHGELRDGMRKPCFDEREEDLDIELIRTEPGDAVVFHDRLLHGGAPNLGAQTRVSFELTLFVPLSSTTTA